MHHFNLDLSEDIVGPEGGLDSFNLDLPDSVLDPQGAELREALSKVNDETSASDEMDSSGCFTLMELPDGHSGAAPGFDLGECSLDHDVDHSGWKPGINVGDFIRRVKEPLTEQSQVLIANAYASLARLPTKYLKDLCSKLLPMGSATVRPWALQAAAQITRVAGNTIGCVWDRLRRRDWQPKPASTPHGIDQGGQEENAEAADAKAILQKIVAECVANASAGLTDAHYARSLQRYRLRGETIGDKYHSPEFARLTEHLACRTVKALDSVEIQTPLAGLGVPTHFSLMWDGVNLGATTFSRHESLCVIAPNMVSPTTGQLHPRLLAAPSMGWDHSGVGQAELVRASLEAHEARLSAQVCQRRLSALGGDGAICRGGPAAKHKSTAAAEKLWSLLGRTDKPVVHWDPYHRDEAARKHAYSEIPMVAELHDLAAVVSALSLDFSGNFAIVVCWRLELVVYKQRFFG